VSKLTAKAEVGPEKGRKAAYFSRNRTALILATQELLGDKGWNATIEQVASNAEISVSTVYQHFDSKDELFKACIIEGWVTFVGWALKSASNTKDPLEQLVVPMRLMARMTATHPMFAKMVAKNQNEITQMIPALTKDLGDVMRHLVKAKILDVDSADIRINNLKAVLWQIFLLHLNDPKANATEADLAIAIALPMLGISASKASAITTAELPVDATKQVL
jgi:AcrR family transcriptional regulator